MISTGTFKTRALAKKFKWTKNCFSLKSFTFYLRAFCAQPIDLRSALIYKLEVFGSIMKEILSVKDRKCAKNAVK